MDAGTVTAAWLGVAGISGFYQVQKKHDPFPVLLASGIGFGALSAFGQFVDWQVAAVLSLLTLLAVFIWRGLAIVQSASQLINSAAPTGK